MPAALLLALGAALALVGSVGLLRLYGVYELTQAPSLATTLGIGCVLLASMLAFTMLGSRPVLHERLITGSLMVTTPVTMMLLARAALCRDQCEGSPEVPPPSEHATPPHAEG
jgi:multicomponent K+:H+ antiporter subunit G